MNLNDNKIIYIEGNEALEGEVSVDGAKSAILSMLVASLIAKKGETVLFNCPNN